MSCNLLFMKQSKYYFFIGLLILLMAGCMSSKKALQQGDYLQSCNLAINKLRSNPQHKSSVQSLGIAYPLLLSTKKSEVDNLLSLGAEDKYRRIYDIYASLNAVYQNIKTCPGALSVIPNPEAFFDQQAQSQKAAFEECAHLGDLRMQLNTRDGARQAYYLYLDALKYKENDPVVAAKKLKALDAGTVRVLVEQIPAFGRYQLSAGFFYDQVFTYLNNNPRNIFTRYYQPQEARKIKLIPDHTIVMSFDDFVVGQVYDSSSSKEYQRDSVVVGTVKTRGGKEMNVYGTVKAKMIVHTRTVESKGILSVQIEDSNTKQLLANEKFPGSFVWENKWAKYNGDERALSREQLKLCDRDAVLPPDNQALFIEFTKPIFSSVSQYLSRFYQTGR